MALKASRNCWRETWSISRIPWAVSLIEASRSWKPSWRLPPTSRRRPIPLSGSSTVLLASANSPSPRTRRAAPTPSVHIWCCKDGYILFSFLFVGVDIVEGLKYMLAANNDTAKAIREIDQVSRQQFLEAFKAINAYFAESFQTLFGGGNGQMRLSDESDPESGIDIVAQPPGKRLQNVLLLSGGEKALAALALLIAMFRCTPSPFCILDEVDAPLDESNVDRFTRLIREMSRHTQFILITHNKRTMEIAQALYGVTMEEPGVSKLVSVRFDEIHS